MKTNKESYKIYDQTDTIIKARELLSKIKKKPKMNTYKIDADKFVQVREGKNPDTIINKLKSKEPKVSVE